MCVFLTCVCVVSQCDGGGERDGRGSGRLGREALPV